MNYHFSAIGGRPRAATDATSRPPNPRMDPATLRAAAHPSVVQAWEPIGKEWSMSREGDALLGALARRGSRFDNGSRTGEEVYV